MNVKKLLYESFERSLNEEEKNTLTDALVSSRELREEREKILGIRARLSAGAVRDFSDGFEEKVLRKINSPAVKKNTDYLFFKSLNMMFKRIVYATVIIIVISVSYNFSKSGSISIQSALGIKQQETTLADAFYNKLYSFFN